MRPVFLQIKKRNSCTSYKCLQSSSKILSNCLLSYLPTGHASKSTAQEKHIGKRQRNVSLWAHACRHKPSIHLQQNVYSYFLRSTGCKYEHWLFDKKWWTNTQGDSNFWARVIAPNLLVINTTLITAHLMFYCKAFLSRPLAGFKGFLEDTRLAFIVLSSCTGGMRGDCFWTTWYQS